jgi:hypothetical protein
MGEGRKGCDGEGGGGTDTGMRGEVRMKHENEIGARIREGR